MDRARLTRALVALACVLCAPLCRSQPPAGYIDPMAWAHKRYTYASFNATSRVWRETMGTEQHGSTGSTPGATYSITTPCASGNGAAASVCAVQGTVTTRTSGPTIGRFDTVALSAVPATFTLCTVSRYASSTLAGRVLQEVAVPSTTNNWLHGHRAGFAGSLFYGVSKLETNMVSPNTNWLVLCSTNAASGGFAVSNNATTWALTAQGGTTVSTIGVNPAMVGGPDQSNFAVMEVVMWNFTLPLAAAQGVAQYYTDVLAGTATQGAASVPVACPVGTYNPQAGASVCLSCPAGSYAGVAGLAACVGCPAGTYATGTGLRNSSACLACLAGAYSSGTGMADSAGCVACGGGSYSTGSGASVCAGCAAGSYSTGVGLSTSAGCQLCVAGAYSTASGLADSAGCLACSGGSYSTGMGSSVCTRCAAGTYSTGVGLRDQGS
jgi:hypothetical protein